MDALFGEDTSDEKDGQDDDFDGDDADGDDEGGDEDDDDGGSSMYTTSTRSRKNSSTPLVGRPGPMRRISTKLGEMFGRNQGNGSGSRPNDGYGQIGQ